MAIHHTSDPAATEALGEQLAKQLRPGDLVTLRGELGAGKTTFTNGLARGLGVQGDVTSPTFVLIIEHEGEPPLLHLDAYRLESLCYDAIRDAGIFDFLDREDAVKLIEWPERIADFLPKPRFDVAIGYGEGEDERIIEVTSYEA